MRKTLCTLALLAACFAPVAELAAARPAQAVSSHQAVPDPALQVREWAVLFRFNDVAGLAQALLPPSAWEEARLAHELKQLEPLPDHAYTEFAEKLEQLTGPDAVDRMMAEIEPKLEEARPKAAGAIMMASGAMLMAVNSVETPLTDDQREMLRTAMPGINRWLTGTDFLSSARMRQALTLLVDAARLTGIRDPDDLRALPIESLLDRMRPMLAAAKQAVRLYGIDLDAVADSLRAEMVSIDGDTARVRTTITLFGAPLWHEHELQLIEGRWYGAVFSRAHQRHRVARAD